MEDIRQNQVVFKIHNGTRRSDTHLCRSCRWAVHMQSALSNKERILCNATHRLEILEPVAHCSAYLDRTKPTLEEMQAIAWSLQTDKGGRTIGFMSPEDLRRRGDFNDCPPTSNPGFGA